MSVQPSRISIRATVLRRLTEEQPEIIDEKWLTGLEAYARAELGRPKPLSRSYLLDVLSHTDVPISRSLGGLPVDLRHRVKFKGPQEAAQSLTDLQREYEASHEAGDRIRCEDCRRAVRQAKDRLRMLLRRKNQPVAKRAERLEILQWFLVWLESPSLFSHWLKARLDRLPSEIGVPSGTDALKKPAI